MPVFEITGPDGKTYEVEGATPDGALMALQEHLGDAEGATQTRSMGDEIKRQLGLTARAIGEGVAGTAGIVYDPLAYLQNKAFGTEVPPLSQQASAAMTKLGVPSPETGVERLVQMGGQGMVGGGATVKAAKAVARFADDAVRTIANQAAVAPGSQVVSGGGGGAAQQAVAEGGGGAVPQLVAGMVGGSVPAAGVGQGRRVADQAGSLTSPQQQTRIEPTLDPLPPRELTDFGRQAAEGNKRAQRILAEESMPDAETVAAAKRLVIYDYLQPDQVTTNQAYREFAQAVKSVPGSSARAKELENFEQLFKRANDLVEEIGGTNDMSALDKGVRTKMFGMQQELETRADNLYARVKSEVDPSTRGPADATLSYLNNQIEELGGISNLSADERRIYQRLIPKTRTVDGLEETVLPTYANIDRLRHELTSARSKKQGPFKDMDSYSAGQIERALREDQVSFLEGNPKALDMFEDAQATVRVRKGLENDIEGLFSKNLDGSLLQGLRTGTTKLAAGDVSQFRRLVGQIPEDMRSEVVASSLQAAFRRNAKDGNVNFSTFSKWYEGLRNNREAYKTFMQYLPPGADKMLNDLYRVSSGVSKASRERITTGRIQAVVEDIKGADNLLRRVYDVTKRSAPAVVLEPAATSIGLPGAGVTAAVASALTKGKPDVLKRADELITSPQFGKLIESVNTDGVNRASAEVLRSNAFKRWANAVGLEKPQEWMQGVIQAGRLSAQNEEDEDE